MKYEKKIKAVRVFLMEDCLNYVKIHGTQFVENSKPLKFKDGSIINECNNHTFADSKIQSLYPKRNRSCHMCINYCGIKIIKNEKT